MTSSKPAAGDYPRVNQIVELVTRLRALGAVQITWGDFQCTLEPPSPFMPPPREAVLAGQDEDDVFADQSDAQKVIAQAERAKEQKQRAVEFELYGASEMRD